MSLHLGLQLSLILIDSCGLSNDPESDAHSSDSDRTDQDQRTRKVRRFILYPFQQPLQCSSCLHQSPPEYQTFVLPSFFLSLPCFSTPSPLFWFYSSLLRAPLSINPTATHGTKLTSAYNGEDYQGCLMKHTLARVSPSEVLCVAAHRGEKEGKILLTPTLKIGDKQLEIARREENTATTQCREKIKDWKRRARYWCPCCDGFQSVLRWGWNKQNKTVVVSKVGGILRF